MSEPASRTFLMTPPGTARARGLRAALHLVFWAAMGSWVVATALAAMPGEGGAAAHFADAAFGLLAAAVAGVVLLLVLRENGKLYAGLVAAQDRERRQGADLQRLCAQLENLNAVLAVKNRQLQEATQGRSGILSGPPPVIRHSRDEGRVVDTGRMARMPEQRRFEALSKDGLSIIGRGMPLA